MTNRPCDRRYDTGTDGAFGRFRRRVAAWLGLLVLAFNIAGTAALAPAAANTPDAATVTVCTAAGLMVMPLGEDPASDGRRMGDLCAWCLPLAAHGGAAPLSVAALPPPGHALAQAIAFPALAEALSGTRPFSPSHPRAPPLPADPV